MRTFTSSPAAARSGSLHHRPIGVRPPLGLLTFVLAIVAATSSAAITLTVNSVGDRSDPSPGDGTCWTSGFITYEYGGGTATQPECTLRAAIEEANALPESDSIHFSEHLPIVAGEIAIEPESPLPMIVDALIVNGYTAPGYASANPYAKPVIHLSGTKITSTSQGLWVGPGADYTMIRGLAITGFSGQNDSISAY
jgi:CSLREA domain-containing protein